MCFFYPKYLTFLKFYNLTLEFTVLGRHRNEVQWCRSEIWKLIHSGIICLTDHWQIIWFLAPVTTSIKRQKYWLVLSRWTLRNRLWKTWGKWFESTAFDQWPNLNILYGVIQTTSLFFFFFLILSAILKCWVTYWVTQLFLYPKLDVEKTSAKLEIDEFTHPLLLPYSGLISMNFPRRKGGPQGRWPHSH